MSLIVARGPDPMALAVDDAAALADEPVVHDGVEDAGWKARHSVAVGASLAAGSLALLG